MDDAPLTRWQKQRGVAKDQPALSFLRNLQDKIGCQLVGCILLLPQEGDLEQTEQGVTGFVQENIDDGTDECMLPRNGG